MSRNTYSQRKPLSRKTLPEGKYLSRRAFFLFPEENYLCLERYFVFPDGNSTFRGGIFLLFKRAMKSRMIQIELHRLVIVGDRRHPSKVVEKADRREKLELHRNVIDRKSIAFLVILLAPENKLS